MLTARKFTAALAVALIAGAAGAASAQSYSGYELAPGFGGPNTFYEFEEREVLDGYGLVEGELPDWIETLDPNVSFRLMTAIDLESDEIIGRLQQAIGVEHFTEGGGAGVAVYDPASKHLIVRLPQSQQILVADFLSTWGA